MFHVNMFEHSGNKCLQDCRRSQTALQARCLFTPWGNQYRTRQIRSSKSCETQDSFVPTLTESQCQAAKAEAFPTIDKTIFVASTDSSLKPSFRTRSSFILDGSSARLAGDATLAYHGRMPWTYSRKLTSSTRIPAIPFLAEACRAASLSMKHVTAVPAVAPARVLFCEACCFLNQQLQPTSTPNISSS